MTLPANIRVNLAAPFPSIVKGQGLVAITKANGVWSVSLNFAALAQVQAAADPANTYVLALNGLTGVQMLLSLAGVGSSKVVKVIAAAGPYAAQPNDDVLIIKQTPFTVTVDWSARAKPLRVVDGKGDASINNITITPAAGQSQLAVLNGSYIIDGNGGSIVLTPLPDGTGAY